MASAEQSQKRLGNLPRVNATPRFVVRWRESYRAWQRRRAREKLEAEARAQSRLRSYFVPEGIGHLDTDGDGEPDAFFVRVTNSVGASSGLLLFDARTGLLQAASDERPIMIRAPALLPRDDGGLDIITLVSGRLQRHSGVDARALEQVEAFTAYASPGVGDLDGDGDADVGARGELGLWCAKNTAGSFSRATLWVRGRFSDRDQWTSPAASGSLQLVDANGDGRADVCGRAPTGVVCAYS
ncbi:hypothetical protein KDL45_16180, partial [bacterium]|nr:hypothetical protein [bacterium]